MCRHTRSNQPRDRSSDSQGLSRIQQTPPIEEARQDPPLESSEHSPADTLRWPDSRLHFGNRADTALLLFRGPPTAGAQSRQPQEAHTEAGSPRPKLRRPELQVTRNRALPTLLPAGSQSPRGCDRLSIKTISKSVPAVAPWHTKGPYDVDGVFRTSPSSQGTDHVPLQRSLWMGVEQHLGRASGGF